MLSNENWATNAPESRLYKGKNLFRWDDSPGLEHHCGICTTPLHNARAKTSCIGKHVEPCYRFHQQLHFIGRSQECFGCNSSDEMHHKRHKEILQLVRKIVEFDTQDGTFTVAPHPPDLGTSTRDDVTTTSASPAHACSGSVSSDNYRSTKARKKLRVSLEFTPATNREIEVFPRADLNFISYALHKMVLESKGACAGSYSYYNPNLTTIKQNDSIVEGGLKDAGVVETLEEEQGGKVGNLSVEAPKVANLKTHKKKGFGEKQLHEMTPRQRKVQNFMYSCGGNSRKYDPERTIKPNNLYCGVEPEVFLYLGIEIVNPLINSKERKSLVAKLVSAIREDLAIQEREEGECRMREKGFWRWAGETALQHMTRTRQGIDWATGMKIESLKAAGLIKEDEDDEDTFEKSADGGGIEFELEFDVGAAPTPDTAGVSPSNPGDPSTPANIPVKFKCYAPTIRLINTDGPSQIPREKAEKNDKSTVSFDSKVFTQAKCHRPYGKPIIYSKAVTASPSFLDNTKDFAVVSGNQPAEVFTQKEDVNDNLGWATVGKGGKSIPVITAKSETKVAIKTTTSENAKDTKSIKRKKT